MDSVNPDYKMAMSVSAKIAAHGYIGLLQELDTGVYLINYIKNEEAPEGYPPIRVHRKVVSIPKGSPIELLSILM